VNFTYLQGGNHGKHGACGILSIVFVAPLDSELDLQATWTHRQGMQPGDVKSLRGSYSGRLVDLYFGLCRCSSQLRLSIRKYLFLARDLLFPLENVISIQFVFTYLLLNKHL